VSRFRALRDFMRDAHAAHPPVAMTYDGRNMGTGGAPGTARGIRVHCGNAAEVAAHLARILARCPWILSQQVIASPTEVDVVIGLHPDAPGLDGGPLHRQHLGFGLSVLRQAAAACMEAGSQASRAEREPMYTVPGADAMTVQEICDAHNSGRLLVVGPPGAFTLKPQMRPDGRMAVLCCPLPPPRIVSIQPKPKKSRQARRQSRKDGST
jgi:hypothetical protein